MLESGFRFEAVVADAAGALVHRQAVDDLQPIVEDMRFAAVRTGVLPNDGRRCRITLTPIWSERGAPRVAVISAQLGAVRKAYGPAMAADLLRAAALEQAPIAAALEHEGARLEWWLEAHPREEHAEHHVTRFTMTTRQRPLPLVEGPLRVFGLSDDLVTYADPVAIAIQGSVLGAVREETSRNLDVERADILLGHVVLDEARRIAVVVTDRIPAVRETTASREHFAFSPLTFEAARRAVAARPDGAVVVGWAHTHPPPCGGDCLRTVPPCRNDTLFLSAPADRRVHRACFSMPYMLALVSGKAAGRRASDPEVRAWGWRDAAIVAREFIVI
jgi:proteasome lid subunit RPN8/RPN11